MEALFEDIISEEQRGFLPGRSLIANVVDIEHSMLLKAAQEEDPAAIFFDFKAAFPSISHELIAVSLKELGVPSFICKYIDMLYYCNESWVMVGNRRFDKFGVKAGIRQGCPLSPLIFAIVCDTLLRKIKRSVPDATLRAYADDIALVSSKVREDAGLIMGIFNQFGAISGLHLNLAKVFVVPLGDARYEEIKRDMELATPSWGRCAYRGFAEYLGFFLGPDKQDRSWRKAVKKYEDRAKGWRDAGVGLYYTILYYNVYLFSVLTFIAQLEAPPDSFPAAEKKALNRLIKGPGGWMDPGDFKYLRRGLLFPIEIRDLGVAAKAAKLRVLHQEGYRRGGLGIDAKNKELEAALSSGPFATRLLLWHDWGKRAFVSVLWANKLNLSRLGITKNTLLANIKIAEGTKEPSLQKLVVKALLPINPVVKNGQRVEERIRYKLKDWKLDTWEGRRARRAMEVIPRLPKLVPPRVQAAVFRTWYKGWVNSWSNHIKGFASRCPWGCPGPDKDTLEHVSVCSVVHGWRHRRFGLKLHDNLESRRTAFLLLDGSWHKDDEELCCAAIALAAVYSVSNLNFHTKLGPQAAYDALSQAVREMTRGHDKALRLVSRVWAA